MRFSNLRILHQLLEASDAATRATPGAATRRFGARCQFPFPYHAVPFAVSYLGDIAPRALLLGHRGAPFAIRLAVDDTWEVATYLDAADYARVRAAVLARHAEQTHAPNGFAVGADRPAPRVTGVDFVRALHDAVPTQLDTIGRVRPRDLAGDAGVTEPEKPYFSHWQSHPRGPTATNLEKTRVLIGEEAAALCRRARLSSCWTADERRAREPDLPRHREARVIAGRPPQGAV
jgi:hypothetical protein